MQTSFKVLPSIRLAVTVLALSWLAACSSDDDDPPPSAELPPVVSVADLTNESAADYAHNRWGLIEPSTLQTFVENWTTADTAAANAPPTGRPAHLSSAARLVVLHLSKANRAVGEHYIPSNAGNHIYAYELDNFRFNEVRDTGLVSSSVRYQASGATADAWLAKYGIDLSRDYVVIVEGENTAANGSFFQETGRFTYWLNYWGADVRNLAVVNGTLKQNYAGTLVATATAPSSVSNGGFSVKDLRVDHTALSVPLEDVLDVVDAGLQSNVIEGFDSQLIIDARPTAQFDRTAATASFHDTHPGQFITTAWNSSGAPSNDATGKAKNYVPYEGHLKGATSFPWASLLQDTGGNNWKYKSKSDLATIFQSAGYAPADVADKVIVSQCRTNFEVQVNGFAARLILGYPTVYYDGSLVEYTSLVSNHPDSALNLLPSDPAYRYRTDTPQRSQRYTASGNPEAPTTTPDDAGVVPYNIASGTGPSDRKIAQAVINRNATTTRKALDEDIEYKRQ